MKPCCGNCFAWRRIKEGEPVGECHFAPPGVIFMGYRPPAIQGQPPIPMINAAFPAIDEGNGCLQHIKIPSAPVEQLPAGHPALQAVPTSPDHTAGHDMARDDAGMWVCRRCKTAEYEIANKPCVGANDA